jgi:D-proline reductase (dithiol) PrdB
LYDPESDLNLYGKAWLALGIGPRRDTPALHRLTKPLSQTRLTLVSSGGFVTPGGEPFQTGKRGDPSFRQIPRDQDLAKLEIHHPHYDHEGVKRDLNILFPIPLCQQLVAEGRLGELATTHYSFMGYVPLTRQLEKEFAPRVARRMKQEDVDAALFTPA